MNPQASGPEHDRPRRSPGHRGLLCPACINDVRQIRTHKGLLRRRGLVTQRLPGAPPAGKTPQTHPAAQAKKPRSQPHANPHSLSTWCWVLGTLLGSALTYVFQRKSAERSETFSFRQQLRSERISAYTAFAVAATEFRRGQYD